ncbi:MAG: hypothetical protein RXQ98_02935 [Sulfolobaceae archaeon]
MRFLVFNPRRWELVSLNPFDFGLEDFVNPVRAKLEYENFLEKLKELGEVKDVCDIVEREKLVELVYTSIPTIGEGKIEEKKLEKSILSLDREDLCNLFILNPTVIISENENRKVPKLRVFSEKIRGELMWLHRYALIDKIPVIGFPSISTSKFEIKFLYYSLKKEINREPLMADYPPSLLNFDDIIIDKLNNLLIAQIGGSTNVEGLSKLFKLRYTTLGEVYLDNNSDKLPIFNFIRFLEKDSVIINKKIFEKSRVDVYEFTGNNYHFKYTTDLKSFLKLYYKNIIIAENKDMSFLVNDRKVLIKEKSKSDELHKIFRDLGLDIITVTMNNLSSTYNGPYNLVIVY